MLTQEKLAELTASLRAGPGRDRLVAAMGDCLRQSRIEARWTWQVRKLIVAYGYAEAWRMLERHLHRQHLNWIGLPRSYWGA